MPSLQHQHGRDGFAVAGIPISQLQGGFLMLKIPALRRFRPAAWLEAMGAVVGAVWFLVVQAPKADSVVVVLLGAVLVAAGGAWVGWLIGLVGRRVGYVRFIAGAAIVSAAALLALPVWSGPPSPEDLAERMDEYSVLVQQYNDDWDMGMLMPDDCRQTATEARYRNDLLGDAISYAFYVEDWQEVYDLWGEKVDLLVLVDGHMRRGCPSALPGTAIPVPLAVPPPQGVRPAPRATATPVAVRPVRPPTPAPTATRTPRPPIEVQITITMPERPEPPSLTVPTLVTPTPVRLTPELPTREPESPDG